MPKDSDRDPMEGKSGFAPITCKVNGIRTFMVVPITYGVRGYDPSLGKPCATFYEAELKAAELNREAGLTDEEAWLLGENAVMHGR